jgi:hypothetical protein
LDEKSKSKNQNQFLPGQGKIEPIRTAQPAFRNGSLNRKNQPRKEGGNRGFAYMNCVIHRFATGEIHD